MRDARILAVLGAENGYSEYDPATKEMTMLSNLVPKTLLDGMRGDRLMVGLSACGSPSTIAVEAANSSDGVGTELLNPRRIVERAINGDVNLARILWFGIPGPQATYQRLRLVASDVPVGACTVAVFGLEPFNRDEAQIVRPSDWAAAEFPALDPNIGVWQRLTDASGNINITLPGMTDSTDAASYETDGVLELWRGAPRDVLLRGSIATITIVQSPSDAEGVMGVAVEAQLIS
jgi:hypothetical protein